MKRIRATEQVPIDEEIAHSEREIRRCKDQELRLVKLYQFGEIDDEWIKAQSGPVRLMRERYEAELERLKSQKVNLKDLERTEDRLREFCERIRSNLEAFDFEEKRMALSALQIKSIVTKDEVRVKGSLGVTGVEPDLATTARTLA